MAAQKKTKPFTFFDQIRQALNHFRDARWLGERSPLAAPYFLGEILARETKADARGRVLQEALQAAAAALWPGELPLTKDALLTAVNEERQELANKGPLYQFLLLELSYFRRYFRPTDQPRFENNLTISQYLNVSRASYFNHLKEAQRTLGEALLVQVRPTFRLEQPLPPPHTLVGREALTAQCLAALQDGRSVALNGMGGAGKTTLATAVAQAWPQGPVFWFTLRPTFNDHLNCLLFSLAYFLHRQGASGLWQQLVADGGKVDNYDLTLAQARGDLQSLPSTPLLCIDEIDVLYADPETITPARLQVREFLDGLRQYIPLLFIGQQQLFAVPDHITVPHLDSTEADLIFKEFNLTLSPAERRHLHTYTDGNPRLLQLCASLIERGMPAATVTGSMPHTPVLQAVWARLWLRFDEEERRLLQHLSVFRSPAPADAWRVVEDVLERLRRRHIVQQDGTGGLILLPAIRDLIYADRQQFPAEAVEKCHLLAAEIRATRGEYTAAAYHYQQAREEQKSIQIWFPHRQQEIKRGQARMAQTLFHQLSGRMLEKREKQALALIRSELHHLAGEAQEGLAALKAVRWPRSSEISTQARQLQGDFLNMLGYPHAALEQYDSGMAVIARLLNRSVRYRYERASIHVQQKELEAANQEATMAHFEASYLQGMVHDENGRYADAVHQFQQALTYAQDAGHETGVAQVHRELSKTLGRQAKLDEAVAHARAAIQTFSKVGDRLNEQRVRSNLAAAYFQAGRFKEAILEAEPVVTFFEEGNMPFWTAVTAATLAEAHYELGQLPQAEQIAHKVLRLEENQTQPYALYTLGLIDRRQERLAEAAQHFQASQQIAHENGDHYLEAYAWRSLGEVLRQAGQPANGREAAQRALALFTALGMDKEISVTRSLLQNGAE